MKTKESEVNPVYVLIYQHIRSHNNIMTDEYLETLEDRQLLCEVHPTYVDYFTNLLFPPKQKHRD